MDVVVQDGQWSDEEYQPVVLKLEVHFAAATKRNNHQKKKKNKKNRMWMMNNQTSITSRSDSSGFIHLFLPLSVLPPRPTTTTTTTTSTPTPTPAATTTVVSAPETLTHRPPSRVNTNKKTKKKKRKKKKQQQQRQKIDDTIAGAEKLGDDAVYKAVPVQQASSTSNRLMPLLLHDDGIPPMLNSLSSDETQQWARWLRCTLCLKV